MRLRDLARNSGCDILTGAMLSTSVYGTPTTNLPTESEAITEQTTEEERSEQSEEDSMAITEARTIAPFSNITSDTLPVVEEKQEEEAAFDAAQGRLIVPEPRHTGGYEDRKSVV